MSKLQGSYCGAALGVLTVSLILCPWIVCGSTGQQVPRRQRDVWSGRNSGRTSVPSLPTPLAGTLDKIPASGTHAMAQLSALPSINKPNASKLFLTLEIPKGTAGRGMLYFIYCSKMQKTVFREKRSKSLC